MSSMKQFVTKAKKVSKDKIQTMLPSNLPVYWKKTLSQNCRILPFYGQTHKVTGFLSNFYPSGFKYRLPTNVFIDPGKIVTVKHAEQAIMLTKAALFNDRKTFDRIQKCSSPASCKRLGRMVKDFNEETWSSNVINIAVRILRYKFSAGDMEKLLLNTGSMILAEASPRDRIWGIGLSATDCAASDHRHWRGFNLLGYALMKVREKLAAKTK